MALQQDSKQEKEYYVVPHHGARCLANMCVVDRMVILRKKGKRLLETVLVTRPDMIYPTVISKTQHLEIAGICHQYQTSGLTPFKLPETTYRPFIPILWSKHGLGCPFPQPGRPSFVHV